LVQTNALFQKNALVSAQLPIDFDEKETVYEKMNDAEKKGKFFPFFNRRKTLFFGNVAFFSLTGIQFPLTTFPYYCQTWEKQESEFQKFTFLQSNTALIIIYLVLLKPLYCSTKVFNPIFTIFKYLQFLEMLSCEI
jgi:Na+/melibiose symporter-like transporter